MQAMYLKDPRDTAAIDVASAVLSSDAWIYGGAYVIETIMATEDAMTAAGNFPKFSDNFGKKKLHKSTM